MSADDEAIRRLGEQYSKSYATSDLDLFADVFDEDIVMILPDRPNVVGKAALIQHQREFLSRTETKLVSHIDEIEVRGDLAHLLGHGTFDITFRESGEQVGAPVSFISVLRKSTDGRWRIWRNIFNYDRPFSS